MSEKEKLLKEKLSYLNLLIQDHYGILQNAGIEYLETQDVLFFAVYKRSLSLIAGFTQLIEARNFICAAPLVRLQVDNLIRLRAGFVVEDINEFVFGMLQGKKISQMQDKNGQKMTDYNLQKLLSEEYPWLQDIYKQTSGYIHLSEQHYLNIVQKESEDKKQITEFYVGPKDKVVTLDTYLNTVETMIVVTVELMRFGDKWSVQRKKKVSSSLGVPLSD
jgi:hypothetical protein